MWRVDRGLRDARCALGWTQAARAPCMPCVLWSRRHCGSHFTPQPVPWDNAPDPPCSSVLRPDDDKELEQACGAQHPVALGREKPTKGNAKEAQAAGTDE